MRAARRFGRCDWFSCSWNNHSADPPNFPREMCVAFFYYFPGNGDELCNMVER